MARPPDEYFHLIRPLFEAIDIYNGVETYLRTSAAVPRKLLHLYAAHFALSEIYNGGFLQLFWNNTGVLVPEAIEGYQALGMHLLAAAVTQATGLLGEEYPRDRDERWTALLLASGHSEMELAVIFEEKEQIYIAFERATALMFDDLNKQAWELTKTESGGFQEAAALYAKRHLVEI